MKVCSDESPYRRSRRVRYQDEDEDRGGDDDTEDTDEAISQKFSQKDLLKRRPISLPNHWNH